MTLLPRAKHWLHGVALLLALLVWALPGRPEAAERVVTLATWEQVPYVGATAPGGGYAHEVVAQALARSGYRLRVRTVPAARAHYLAVSGAVDGVMPLVGGPEAHEGLSLSAPFPGDHPGVLKRRGTPFRLPAEAGDRAQLWNALRPYRIGLPWSEYELLGASQVPGLRMELAPSDLQNIDKLAHKRVDLLVIDRFTAANLILRQRPHLVGELQFVAAPELERAFHVGFSRRAPDHAALVKAFDEGLAALRKDGTLERLRARHGLTLPRPRRERDGKLVIATVNNPDMETLQKLGARYEAEHPGVTLEWTVLDENTLRTRLLSDVALDDGQYDVLTIGSFEATTWAQMEWLAPIADLPASYDLDDVLPAIRAHLTTRGALYALPFYAEASVTMYRKDLFQRAGLTMPERPTYAQIEAFARALHDPGHGVSGLCLRGQPGWGANMAFLTTLVHTAGGRWFDLSWRPELDQPAWRRAFELYQRLARYAPSGVAEANYVQNLELFKAGKCALWVDASVALGQLFDARSSSVHDRTGFVRAPIDATEHGASWLWVWALGVSRSSRSYDDARAFVLWATSKEYASLVASRHGALAMPPGVRRSTYEEASYLRAAPFAPFVRSAVEHADVAHSTREPSPYEGHYVSIPEYPALGDAVGLEAQRMIRGEQSAESALGRAQTTVRELMRASFYEGR